MKKKLFALAVIYLLANGKTTELSTLIPVLNNKEATATEQLSFADTFKKVNESVRIEMPEYEVKPLDAQVIDVSDILEDIKRDGEEFAAKQQQRQAEYQASLQENAESIEVSEPTITEEPVVEVAELETYTTVNGYERVAIANPEADAHRIYSDPMIYWQTVYPENAEYLYNKIITTAHKNVVDSFISDFGGYFIITDLATVREESSDNAVAYYWANSWGEGAILDNYICIEDNVHSIDLAVNHELGHFVDKRNGDISSSAEWTSIYETYKYSGCVNEYASSSPKEFFAECYRLYVENGEMLINSCPMAYTFVQTAENNIF